MAPPHDVPETPEPEYSDEEVYTMVKPSLDKVVAPFRRRIQDVDEKIARRTSILSDLVGHQDDGTVPKAIVVPRFPQCPSSQEEEFREKFKVLTKGYCKEATQLLIDARVKDIKELRTQRQETYNEASIKVEEALQHAYNIVGHLTKERVTIFTKRYNDDLQNELEKSRVKIELKLTFGTFVDSEKRSADLLKKAAVEADEEVAPDTQGVDRLRQELSALRKDVKNIRDAQKKNVPKKNDKPKAKKGGQGNASKSSGKAKKKPKNGKQGAAGRGAKQN